MIIDPLLAEHPTDGINVKLIFSRVPSLNFLYIGQGEIEGRSCDHESKYKKWVREGVLRGDMESTEEVLTHITAVY